MRRYSWSEIPYILPEDRARISVEGTERERGTLSYQRNLEPEIAFRLAGDTSERVAVGVLSSESTPTVLDELVRSHPHLRDAAAVNLNASVELKLEAPLYELTEVGLSRFLDDVYATSDERRALYREYRSGRPPGGPTLGSIWKQIRR